MHESATLGSDADGISVDATNRLAYSVPQAAETLSMGERKVWQLVGDGTIRSYTVGKSRRISRQALLDFIKEQEKAA